VLRAYGYFFDRLRHAVETDDLDDEFIEAPEGEEDETPVPSGDVPKALKLETIWQSVVEELTVVEIVLEEGG
jgi:hypothetical protein